MKQPTGQAVELRGRTFAPRNDNVLIALETQKREERGVILPATAQGKAGVVWAEVLSAGPGHTTRKGWFVPTDLAPGDRVLVGFDAGDRLEWRALDGRETRVIRAEEAVAVERAGGGA